MAEICTDTTYLPKRHGDVSAAFLGESTNERMCPHERAQCAVDFPKSGATHPLWSSA